MNPETEKDKLKKSMEAIDTLMVTRKDEVEKLMREIDQMNFEGPNIDEYLGSFESHFPNYFPSDSCNGFPVRAEIKSVNRVFISFAKINEDLLCLKVPPPRSNFPRVEIENKCTPESYSGVFLLDLVTNGRNL